MKKNMLALGCLAFFVAGFLIAPAGAGTPLPPFVPDRVCAGGIVSGRVVDGQGVGIPGVSISGVVRDGSLQMNATSDAQGNYAICLPAGEHGLRFSAGGYIAEMYDNAAYGCADAVTVTAGGTVTGITAVLEKGGAISGRVTDGTNPLPNVAVTVSGIDVSAGGSAATDASGNYTVTGLATGSYAVHFEGLGIGYSAAVYNNRLLSARPDPVAVTAPGTTAGIDADLPAGGSIVGGIGNGITGAPGVRVSAYDSGGAVVRTATSDGLGAFFLVGLRAGSYKLFFEGQTVGLKNEWFLDRATMEAADPVAVLDGQPSILFAELSLGGAISGRVTENGGAAPAYDALAFDESGNLAGYGTTDMLGDYSIGGLPAGTYRLLFRQSFSLANGTWYGNGTGLADAAKIAVSPPAGVAGIDVNIVPELAAPVGGRIDFEGGTCDGTAYVTIYPADPINDEWFSAAATVGPMGDWSSSLGYGSYRAVAGSGAGGSHRSVWYRRSPLFPRSGLLAVADPAGRTGVDFLLPLKEKSPLPDVSVGGYDFVLPLGPGDEQPVTFSLQCNGGLGDPMDWWALLTTRLPPPWNILHYEPGKGWLPGLEPSYQGPCRDIAGRRLKPFVYTSKVGKVDLYFGVDSDMNGNLDVPSSSFDGMRLNMLR